MKHESKIERVDLGAGVTLVQERIEVLHPRHILLPKGMKVGDYIQKCLSRGFTVHTDIFRQTFIVIANTEILVYEYSDEVADEEV